MTIRRCTGRGCIVVLLAVSALALAGCGDNTSDLKAYVARIEARKATKIPPIPKMTPYVAFNYKPAGRRDPFMPENTAPAATVVASAGNGLHPDFSRPKQPLEQYPLDALHMVGTIDFGDVLYAMVSAPDGVIHRVTVGEYMGQNYGRIVRIDPTGIQLSELVPDGFGGWQRRAARLSMAADKSS